MLTAPKARCAAFGVLLAALAGSAHADRSYFLAGPDVAGRLDLHAVAIVRGSSHFIATSTLLRFGKRAANLGFKESATLDQAGNLVFAKSGKCSLAVSQCTIGGSTLRLIEAPDTSPMTVLFVPGLSTNSWNKIGVPYLDENVATARAMGFSARRLGIKTENGVAANARYIADEIRAEMANHRKVIVIAHSKGATDTTAALAMNPVLLAGVYGIVAIQPVFQGSPVAEFVSKRRYLIMPFVKVIFERVFKGQAAAVTDLTAGARRSFLASYPYPANQIRTVVVRSSFNRKLSKSILWANQKLITEVLHAPNDGMVRPADATIPGAAVTLDYDDLDHFEPGLRGESRHTPVDLTSRLLLVLLRLSR